VAVIRAFVPSNTLVVFTVAVAVRDPPTTDTDEGTEATLVFDPSVTTPPDHGTAEHTVIVAFADPPPATDDGDTPTATAAPGITENEIGVAAMPS
jgi:hypothetical protein